MGFSERLAAPRTLRAAGGRPRRPDRRARRHRPGGHRRRTTGAASSRSAGRWRTATQLRGVVLTNTAVASPTATCGPALIRLAHAPGAARRRSRVSTPLFVRATTALSRPALPADVRRAFAAPYRLGRAAPGGRRLRRRHPVPPRPPLPPGAGGDRRGHPRARRPRAAAVGSARPGLRRALPGRPAQRLPQPQLHRYEGASHLLPEDAPQYADGGGRSGSPTCSTEPRDAGRRPTGGAAEPAGRPLWSALLDRAPDDPSPAVVEVGGAHGQLGAAGPAGRGPRRRAGRRRGPPRRPGRAARGALGRPDRRRLRRVAGRRRRSSSPTRGSGSPGCAGRCAARRSDHVIGSAARAWPRPG